MITRKTLLSFAAGVAFVASGIAPAQQRQLMPPTDEQREQLKQSAAAVAAIMDKERAQNAALQNDQAAFANLDAAARKKILSADFAADVKAMPPLKVDAANGFVGSQLKLYHAVMTSDTLTLTHAHETKPINLKPGDTLELKHDDGSSLFVEFSGVTVGAKKKQQAGFRFGDVRYFLGAGGDFTASSAAELRKEQLAILSKYDASTPPIIFRASNMAFTDAVRRLEQQAEIKIEIGSGVDSKSLKVVRKPRPGEFLLSEICMAGSASGGRGLIWEKRGDHFFIRPFPLLANPVEAIERPFELLSLNKDGSADIQLAGERKKVELFDRIHIPMAGKTYAEAIVDQVTAPYHEVLLNCGGGRMVFCNVPEEVASKLANVGEMGAPVDALLRRASVPAGIEIVPDASILKTPLWAPEGSQKIGDLLKLWAVQNGWTMRWMNDKKLVLGTDAAMTSAEWEKARVGAAP